MFWQARSQYDPFSGQCRILHWHGGICAQLVVIDKTGTVVGERCPDARVD
jgi:hypothetical protein